MSLSIDGIVHVIDGIIPGLKDISECMPVYRIRPRNKANIRGISSYMNDGIKNSQVTSVVCAFRSYQRNAFEASQRIDERSSVTLFQGHQINERKIPLVYILTLLYPFFHLIKSIYKPKTVKRRNGSNKIKNPGNNPGSNFIKRLSYYRTPCIISSNFLERKNRITEATPAMITNNIKKEYRSLIL